MKAHVGGLPPLAVCAGGDVDANVTSIQFTNPDPNTYTIPAAPKDGSGNNMPGWPLRLQTIPGAKNGANGSLTVYLSVATISGKIYTYIPSPVCPIGTQPQIKVA